MITNHHFRLKSISIEINDSNIHLILIIINEQTKLVSNIQISVPLVNLTVRLSQMKMKQHLSHHHHHQLNIKSNRFLFNSTQLTLKKKKKKHPQRAQSQYTQRHTQKKKTLVVVFCDVINRNRIMNERITTNSTSYGRIGRTVR